MTLVEFLHPLKGSSLRNLCLAAMYFQQRYEGSDSITVEGLRALLKRARVPRSDQLNLADTLSKSAPYVTIQGKERNRFLWSLTSTGQESIRQLAFGGQHAVQTFAGLVCQCSQLLEAECGVDEIAQDEACCFRFVL
jgi:hypothetical protein